MLDIKMPEMTGIEALKEIRKLDVETPVIMQSAYVFDSDMDAARQAGASDFITKPINLKIFKTTISKYCPSIEWQKRYCSQKHAGFKEILRSSDILFVYNS